MKQILEQIGTNRQVFQKKVEVDFVCPFGSLLRAKALWEELEDSSEGEKEGLSPKFEESPILSGTAERSSNLLRARRRLLGLIFWRL